MNKNDNSIKYIILPENGNLITEKDINQRESLRITKGLKTFFPEKSSTLRVSINGLTEECQFEHRLEKSHYIHLPKSILTRLNLRQGDNLLMKKNNNDLDLIKIKVLTLLPVEEFKIDYKNERVIVVFVANEKIYLGYKNFDGKWHDFKSNVHTDVSHFAKLPSDPISRPDGALYEIDDEWNRIDANKEGTAQVFADKFPFVLLYDHEEIVATDSNSYWFDSKGNTFTEINHWIGVTYRK